MAAIAIHEPIGAPAFLSAGFRPFFLLGGVWAALGVPLWLAAYEHGYAVGGALPAMLWHAHEMVYGFALASVCGFLLTAIPNWTGRLPVRGAMLGALALLWLAGRIALLASSLIGAGAAAAIDLSFTALLMAVVAREVAAAKNFHNVPIVAILGLLLAGNVLVHLHALDWAYTAALGNRIGVATVLLLIALIGGRIIPSFTGNWLAKMRPDVPRPAPHSALDWACLLVTFIGLIAWLVAGDTLGGYILEIVAGIAVAARLVRWRGLSTVREPLLFVLHVGYGWLALGLICLGAESLVGGLAPGAALHALTVGAIGTMTLAVMTRTTLGHTGHALTAGAGTSGIYALVTLAAVLRIAGLISLAGAAWTAAFGLFAVLYAPLLLGKKQ